MNETATITNEHYQAWNGRSGEAWVDAQQALDRLFQPFENLLVEEVAQASVTRVLDVGCGTGATTFAIARHLESTGTCTGIDISLPMIGAARARAAGLETSPPTFIQGDAQTHSFSPAAFDCIVSRFGIMFFTDFVEAFANLRAAAAANAVLACIAWRSPGENPFMTTAERAAATLLPNLPPRDVNAPGQFALADQGRIQHILEQSGWVDIDIEPLDVPCTLPEEALVRYVTRLGPLGQIFPELDEPARTKVLETVLPAFAPYVLGTEVRFIASCWLIRARAAERR